MFNYEFVIHNLYGRFLLLRTSQFGMTIAANS